jgi:hypothetical protein
MSQVGITAPGTSVWLVGATERTFTSRTISRFPWHDVDLSSRMALVRGNQTPDYPKATNDAYPKAILTLHLLQKEVWVTATWPSPRKM